MGWMGRNNQDLFTAPANKSFAPLLRNYYSFRSNLNMPPGGQNMGWMGRNYQVLLTYPANKWFTPLLRNYFSEATSTCPLAAKI